ncbi:GGDEF domain-containing protein [Bacillus kwashiorkori]|uniref:GGDEF domain-containing protein n=1 Tax=Bacillus kwashiorkori TaxID=1522318 RepID=UPI00078446B8|nr:GGDEF domain-containing protein [Bacillus kwashiorkori]
MIGLKRSRFFYICIIFILLFFIFPNISSTSASFNWTIEKIESELVRGNGYKQVLQWFNSEREFLKNNDPALYYYLEGINQVVENNFHKANENFQEGLTISKKEKQMELEIAILKELTVLSEYYGDSGNLVEYGSRLLEIAEENTDAKTQMYAYKTIALSFYYVMDDAKVIEYLEKMLQIANKYDDNFYKAIYKDFHADLLLSYEENKSALKLYEEAGELFNKANGVEADNLQQWNQASIALVKSKLSDKKDKTVRKTVIKEIEQLVPFAENHYHRTTNLEYLYSIKGLIESEYELNQAAVDSFEKSKELSEKIIHIDGRLDAIRYESINLAQAYYENKNFKQAADLYMFVSKMDEDPQTFKDIDEMTSKIRKFTEKELNEKIQTLTALKQAQKKSITQQRIMIVTTIIGIIIITAAFIRVNQLKNSLYVKSVTDGLTGVYNRKKILEILQAEKKDCIVALVDIDNFKSINDTYGYLFGDKVIKKVVQVIKQELADNDEIGRYGGEEFLLIVRDKSFDDSIVLFDRIRKKVAQLSWEHEDLSTAICIGVSKKKQEDGWEEVFRRVDTLVHEAKRTGKNKVLFSD